MGAFIAPVIAGLSALTGAFGNKKQTSTTNSTNTTTPNYDPASLALKNFLLSNYTSSVNGLPAWNKSYETSGLANLVNSAGQSHQTALDALSARGINQTTAGANTIADGSYQQGKQISSFLNNAPLVEQQNTLSTLGGAGSFLSSLPVGSTTTGSSNTTGVTSPTSPIAGAITGGATGLAGLLGQQSANNSLGNILKNLGLNSNGTGSTVAPYNPSDGTQDWN